MPKVPQKVKILKDIYFLILSEFDVDQENSSLVDGRCRLSTRQLAVFSVDSRQPFSSRPNMDRFDRKFLKRLENIKKQGLLIFSVSVCENGKKIKKTAGNGKVY